MKIIFPELKTNSIAKEAANHFKDIEFLTASSLEHAAKILKAGEADSIISGIDYSSRDVVLAYKDYIPIKSAYFSSCFICQKDSQIFALADAIVAVRDELVAIEGHSHHLAKACHRVKRRVVGLERLLYGCRYNLLLALGLYLSALAMVALDGVYLRDAHLGSLLQKPLEAVDIFCGCHGHSKTVG